MKRVLAIAAILAFIFASQGNAQVVNESTKKKISIGIGLFNDIMVNMPSGVKSRIINPGINLYGTYNIPFGNSNFSFAIGLGLDVHNIYGNFTVTSTNDSTRLVKIPDSVSYKRSKITLTYIEIPVEFRYKTKSKVGIALGFKGGIMVGSSSKYVGDGNISNVNYDLHTTDKVRVKFWGLKNLNQFTYGPTLRVGYKWFNVTCYYMLSTIFNKTHGPEMYPISVGFLLMPF